MTERLTKYKADGTKAAVYLFNGVRLIGRVIEFDSESIVLDSEQPGLDDGIVVVRSNIATVQKAVNEDRKFSAAKK
jgi:RNA chaperone Hfq